MKKERQYLIEKTLDFVANKGWSMNGEQFLNEICRFLGDLLNVDYTLVDSYSVENPDIAKTIAIYNKKEFLPNIEYNLEHTPCKNVIGCKLCSYNTNVQHLFPNDKMLVDMNVDSYSAIPLWGSAGEPIGLIAVMDENPFFDIKMIELVLQIVAIKTAHELESIIFQDKINDQIKIFHSMLESISDGVIITNTDREITLANKGMLKTFGYEPEELIGKNTELLYADKSFYEKKGKEVFNKESNFTDKPYITQYKDKNKRIFHGETFGSKLYSKKGIRNGNLGIMRDVSERLQLIDDLTSAKEKAEESEEKYRLLFERDTDAIFIYNPVTTKIIEANKATSKLYGYSSNELIGKSVLEFSAEKEQSAAHINKIKKDGETQVSYRKHKKKDGSIIYVDIKGFKIKLQDQEVMFTVSKDITDKILAEETLQKSELELRAIYENAPLVMLLIDEERKVVKMNAQALLMSQKPEDEALGVRVGEALRCLYSADDARGCGYSESCKTCKIRNSTIETIKTGKSFHRVESIFIYKGTDAIKEKHMLVSTAQIKSTGEERILVCLEDITERKKNEQEIKRKERQYRSLVETSQNLIWICDLNGQFTYLNPAWEKTHGYKLEEMLGKPFSDFQRPEVFERDMIEFSKHLAGGSVVGYETSHIKKNGEEVYLIFNAIPLCNDKGEIVGTQGTAYDITERRQIQQKVLSTVIQTEEAERRRIAQDLHDGIGPLLSTIKLFTQSLIKSDDEGYKKKLRNQIVSSVEEALNQVSTISHMLSPHILSDFGLKVAIDQFKEKLINTSLLNLEFNYSINDSINSKLETTLYRVSIELINNTIKHAKATIAELSITQEKKYIFLNYSDNGKGFDFNKVKESKKGMGLFNIYNRIKSLNGDLDFTKNQGAGITYKIKIPL